MALTIVDDLQEPDLITVDDTWTELDHFQVSHPDVTMKLNFEILARSVAGDQAFWDSLVIMSRTAGSDLVIDGGQVLDSFESRCTPGASDWGRRVRLDSNIAYLEVMGAPAANVYWTFSGIVKSVKSG